MEAIERYVIGSDKAPIVFEPGEPYSCIWPTNMGFLSLLEELYKIPKGSDVILYTKETGENERMQLDSVEEKSISEDIKFFRVNTKPFDLTWEEKPSGDRLIGFISNQPRPETVRRYYQITADERLSEDEFETLSQYLYEH